MSDAYVVRVDGETAGIVVRDMAAETFSFFAATYRFSSLEQQEFAAPYAAERAARQLIARRDPAARDEFKEERPALDSRTLR